MALNELLEQMEAHNASDLHLKPGSPPVLRVHGRLAPLAGRGELAEAQLGEVFEAITSATQRQKFDEELELDFSYQQMGSSRYRVNASLQQGRLSLAIRRIPLRIPQLHELGLPPICASLALKRQGLILVTGPTGSGKSTSLAAMIDHLNQNDARRIVTIEDPIEYIHEDRLCLITQREVGQDTRSFAVATRQALRQDPDVILVGEMRDAETMAACLTAAETGHLVLSTLHTNNGPQTVDRIVDAFPTHRQTQIRMQLSLTLLAAIAQALLPRLDGHGRVAAVEVMLANSAIRNLIREGKTHQMMSVLQTARASGMQTMEQSLKELVVQGLISTDQAHAYANDPDSLRTLMQV